MALLLALVIYTASFIAEIVRGSHVSPYQRASEASKALGLSNGQTFNLVVFPQAMRIIIPPLISNYLNLTKAAQLRFLAAYPEFFKISEIVSNQSGATVPTILLLMAGYLLISWLLNHPKLLQRPCAFGGALICTFLNPPYHHLELP
ncbi:MAG: ABC transporter permease subunit [Deinococcales bacterium]